MANRNAGWQAPAIKYAAKWLDGSTAAWLNVFYSTSSSQNALSALAAASRAASEEARLKAIRCQINPNSPECR